VLGFTDCSQTMRSVLICILDTLSEIAIVAMPGLLVSKLQMQEAKKRMVYTVFAARIGLADFLYERSSSANV